MRFTLAGIRRTRKMKPAVSLLLGGFCAMVGASGLKEVEIMVQRRAHRWLLTRLGLGGDAPARGAGSVRREAWGRVRDAVPRESLRDALADEDDDGGRQRFELHVTAVGMDEDDLARMRMRWRRQALVCWALGLFLTTVVTWLVAVSGGWAIFALGPFAAGLGMIAAGLRADFHAWQIELRRYAAASRYLRLLPGIVLR